MRILITGGVGFLGVHLSRKFISQKHKVILFDIAPLDAKDLFGKVTYIKGDVRNKKDISNAIKGCDYVVHAAAALPIQHSKKIIYSINIDGTKNVLEAAMKYKVKRLVYISSTAVYGVPKYLPETEDSPLDPIGFYGESKMEGEKLCSNYMGKGLSINIIRPKTFLGPERLGVFQLWFEAIYLGKKVFMLGNGNNKYQLLAVSDVVDAIDKGLKSKVKNEIFNIGAKEYSTWRKDLGSVIKYSNSKASFFPLPVIPSQFILFLLEKANLSPISAWHYRTMPVPSYVSIQKAEKLLKWHPKKSNSELLLESYKWYEKNRSQIINRKGDTHRVNWNFKVLNLFKNLF